MKFMHILSAYLDMFDGCGGLTNETKKGSPRNSCRMVPMIAVDVEDECMTGPAV